MFDGEFARLDGLVFSLLEIFHPWPLPDENVDVGICDIGGIYTAYPIRAFEKCKWRVHSFGLI